VKQAALGFATPYSKVRESEVRDQIAFGLTVLLLILLPLERLILPASLRPADLVLVLLTMYGLVKAWRTRQRLKFPLLIPMWLILLSSLVATLLGFVQLDSIIAIVQEIYLIVWFIALTNVLMTFSLSDLDWLMKIWALIACVEAVTTLMGMFRIGPSIFYTLPYRDQSFRTEISRAVGTYVNPNAVAVYLSVSFFVVLATSWSAWLRLAMSAWIYVGMIGTGSNGALVSTLGSFMILVIVNSVIRNHRTSVLWGAVLGLGVSLAATAALIPGLLTSLWPASQLGTNRDLLFLTLGRVVTSLTKRLELAESALKVYMRHPLGIGPNGFFSLQLSLHSDYLAFLFERGPIGLIGWLWLVGATLYASLRAARQLVDGSQRWCVLALGAGFLACAINAFTHEISHMRQVWVLMAFIFAFSYAFPMHQEARSSRST